MSQLFNPMSLSWSVWFITLAVAFLAGLSKSGLKGIVMLGIPVLAFLYGAKQSTGILLPFLVMGDLLAIKMYWAHADWKHVVKLLPFAVVGVLIAVFTGNYIDDRQFKVSMATILLLCILLILYNDLRKSPNSILHHPKVLPVFGLAGGFATMIGNLASPVFSLYLLTLKLPKKEFIGTGAMFYLTLNLFKLPFHVWTWNTITLSSFQMCFFMLPVVVLGFVIGSRLVRLIPESAYRYFILIVTAISSFMLYFK